MYKPVEVGLMVLNESEATERIAIPNEVAAICADLQKMAQEQFVVLTLNAKSRLIGRHMIALGTVSSTLVHPREVFRVAVLDAAMQIIVVHNHPSGDPSPSAQDIRITKKIVDAGKIMEIPVSDHVIIGRPDKSGSCGWLSLRECGLVEF